MNPKQLLERAAYNFLTNLETPLTEVEETSIYKGTENSRDVNHDENTEEVGQKVHPSVTLVAEGNHEEAVFRTRIFRGVLAVTVEAVAAEKSDDDFNTICSEVFSKFNIIELQTNMSAQTANFTLIQGRVIDFGDTVNNGSNWQRTLRLVCIYAGADL